MARKFTDKSLGRFYDVVNRLRANKNESATAAAKAEHTTTRTIKRINEQLGLLELKHDKPGTRYNVSFDTHRTITFIDADGNVQRNIEVDKNSATQFSKYIFSTKDAVRFGGSDAEFKVRANKGIRDIYGTRYKLLANINAFMAILDSEGLSYDDLFYPKK